MQHSAARFGVSYAPEDHPTQISFATQEETVYYSDGSFKNEITIDKGELGAVRYELTDLDGNDTDVATISEDGTVTFLGVGDIKVTASSMYAEASYILHIDERETVRYISDFSAGADGWTIGNGGKEYDRSEVKNGRIELEGSDLGISDTSANAWMYKIFRLKGGYDYELIIEYNTPDSGAATMMRIYIEVDGERTTLRDWTRITNTSERQSVTFDLNRYSGSVVTIGIEQNDKGTGSGEILCIERVALLGTESDTPVPGETHTLSGTTVAGARVELRNADGETIEAVIAAADGSFSFADMPEGNYTLFVCAEGYKSMSVEVTLDGDKAVGEITLEEGTDAPAADAPDYGLIFGCVGAAVVVIAAVAVVLVLRAKKKKNSAKENKSDKEE